MQVALHAPVLCRLPLLSLAHRRSSKPVPSSSLPGLNQTHFHYDQHKRDNLVRSVVVRSELTGTAMPDPVYPLSGPSKNLLGYLSYLTFNSRTLNKILNLQLLNFCQELEEYACMLIAVTAIVAIFLLVLMLVQHPFGLLSTKSTSLNCKNLGNSNCYFFFKIKYEGLENLPHPDTPAVYLSNLQSFLDIFTLLTLGRSFKFISKTSIFLHPIIRWAMSMMGVIPLKRMDSKSLECLKKCMDLIKKGASVCSFPEGTRSIDGRLSTFKEGAFSVATKMKVPVVPVTIRGTGKIMPAGNEGIDKPIEGSDLELLCKAARDALVKALLQRQMKKKTMTE